jgi:hypothetical protein
VHSVSLLGKLILDIHALKFILYKSSFLKNSVVLLGMVTHTCNPNTQEVEVGES